MTQQGLLTVPLLPQLSVQFQTQLPAAPLDSAQREELKVLHTQPGAAELCACDTAACFPAAGGAQEQASSSPQPRDF